MGIFEATGPHASYFLNLVSTNDVNTLRPGESQYTYLLHPNGSVVDDAMIYMISPSRYLIIVNAANTAKDWAWLQAINEREVCIDEARPWARTTFRVTLRDLHSPDESYAWLADMALQGPRSRDVLDAMLDAAPQSSAVSELRARLATLKHTQVISARIPSGRAPGGAYDLLIARTGYTGEPIGFELLIHPDVMQAFWEELLEIGEPFGLKPVGLGARDSLRIEAGLPLYGHELAGPLDLRPDDAGFAGYVKLHKAFFIGRQAYIEHVAQNEMALVRFRIDERGVRVPKPEDVVTDDHGRVVGQVTSCAMDTEGRLTGLAHIDRRQRKRGTLLNILNHPKREVWAKPYENLALGDRLVVPTRATVVRRFMRK
jgi:glycine hydroxymethyltransferase